MSAEPNVRFYSPRNPTEILVSDQIVTLQKRDKEVDARIRNKIHELYQIFA
jgi:hypothetical protein